MGKVTFTQAIASCFRNYANFKGAASRSEFWYWVLFTVLVSMVLGTLESVIWPAPASSGDWMQDLQSLTTQPTPFTTIASLVFLIPNLSVLVRRLHDAGFSGKWLLLQLIPLAYSIFALVGIVVVVVNAQETGDWGTETLMALIFLVLPIIALFLAVFVIYLVMALRPSRSFYDGNKYVEPKPLEPGDEGTTA